MIAIGDEYIFVGKIVIYATNLPIDTEYFKFIINKIDYHNNVIEVLDEETSMKYLIEDFKEGKMITMYYKIDYNHHTYRGCFVNSNNIHSLLEFF